MLLVQFIVRWSQLTALIHSLTGLQVMRTSHPEAPSGSSHWIPTSFGQKSWVVRSNHLDHCVIFHIFAYFWETCCSHLLAISIKIRAGPHPKKMVRANEQHAESRLGRRPGKVQRVPRQLFLGSQRVRSSPHSWSPAFKEVPWWKGSWFSRKINEQLKH